MTTLTALTRPATLFHPGSPGRGFLIGFLGTLALGFMLLAAASIGVSVASRGRIMPGVEVAGVPVGGLDRAAASERLHSSLPSLDEGSITVDVEGEAVEIPVAALGRSYDFDAIVSSAYGVARSGNLVSDAVARLRVLAVPTTHPVLVTTGDGSAIGAVVADLTDRFTATAIDAQVTYDDGAGFVVEEAAGGRQLDATTLRADLLARATDPSGGSGAVVAQVQAIAPDVTTEEAEEAARQANAMVGAPLALRADGDSYPIRHKALAALVSLEASVGTLVPEVNEHGLTRIVKSLRGAVAEAPRNASFEWGTSGIVGVIPAADGLKLDVAASVSAIIDALRDRAGGATLRAVPLAVVSSAPALRTQAARAAAPRMRVLGTWTTYYPPGEGNFWNANIHIPAWDLDGKVIGPGEWFEFWQGIGPVTLERGYGYGGAIIGGRSVPNGALAGGICSTSTTLFNAAMRSGLEIGERTNHSYYIDRYPMGLDATVLKTESWETDITFRNDMANPVVIRSYTGDGWVRFDIWGVPDGRTVRLSAPTTWNHGTAVWTTVTNPNLAPGTSRIVEYPHDGFDSSVTRWVYDANGNVLHENVWVSHYRTVNGITEVGPRR